MSEWIKIKIHKKTLSKSSHMVMLLYLLLLLLLVCLGIAKQIGYLPFFLLLALLITIPAFFILSSSYYLLYHIPTKKLFLKPLLYSRHILTTNDITSISYQRKIVHMTIDKQFYSFPYKRKSFLSLQLLIEHCPTLPPLLQIESISEDPLPYIYQKEVRPVHHFYRLTLVYLRRLLILLAILMTLLLIIKDDYHVHAMLLVSIMILLSISIHITDCLLVSKEFDIIFHRGHVVYGKLLSFVKQHGRHGYPTFEFEDGGTLHKATSLLPMTMSAKEKTSHIGDYYNLWYAPEESAYVLYGDTEPEPMPAHYFSFSVISQMSIALVFLMVLFFVSSPADLTSHALNSPWTSEYLPSSYTQKEIDSDTVQWFCTSYAIKTMALGRNPSYLGGIDPLRPSLVAKEKEDLQTSYGIYDRASAIKYLNYVLEEGARSSYGKIITTLRKQDLFDLSRNEYLEKVHSYHEDYRYLAIYDAYHENKVAGIDAYDYCEALLLLGEYYSCNYINLEECLSHSLPIARKLQSEFTSWKSLGQSYLYGYQFTKQIETSSVAAEYAKLSHCLEELMSEHDDPNAISYDIPLVDNWSSE